MEEYMNTWSQLPNDILVTILLKSSLRNRIRAGAVCVSWQSALKEIKTLKLQPPYLLLSKDLETDIHRFLDLSNNTIYRGIHIPETHDVFYLGSFHGWLILSKYFTRNIFLLNPSSNQQIKLPIQAKIWNLIDNSSYDVKDLGQGDDIPYSTAILSSAPTSDDCVVLILHAGRRSLSFCKLGDKRWTVFKGVSYYDIAWYKGRVYFIRRRLTYDHINLLHYPNFTGWNDLPPIEIEIEEDYIVDNAYLVESCGDLLMILKLGQNDDDKSSKISRARQEFCVFKMDESGRFSIKVESLGDQMLFVGKRCSNSFSAKGLLGFKENCIYFSDDCSRKFSVFHMKDGSIKRRFPTWYFQHILRPFIWLMP